jgi:hypothetical protein
MRCGSRLAWGSKSGCGRSRIAGMSQLVWKRRWSLPARVIRVPAAMTGQARKVSRQAGKSDPIDARAVALAVVRDGVHSFSGRVHRRPGAGDPGAVRLPRSDHL